MTHYTQMLRRHIVSDSEIAELCRRIYRKHQKALDLIFEQRPDQQAEIRDLLEKIVRETPGLLLDHCSKGYVRFASELWDIPQLKSGSGWTSSGRMLLFEFENLTGVLTLRLHIGPGPDETRQKLLDIARTNQPPLKAASKSLNQKWNSIYSKSFLKAKDYEDADSEHLEKEIRKHWAEFIGSDLPKIMDVIKEEKWI
jgi:hypothetical protein